MQVSTHDVRKAIIQGKLKRYYRYIDKKSEELVQVLMKFEDKYQNVTRGNNLIDFKGYNVIQHGCLRCQKPQAHNK
jgi:hypothetical protein